MECFTLPLNSRKQLNLCNNMNQKLNDKANGAGNPSNCSAGTKRHSTASLASCVICPLPDSAVSFLQPTPYTRTHILFPLWTIAQAAAYVHANARMSKGFLSRLFHCLVVAATGD